MSSADRGICDQRYRVDRMLGRGPSGVVYQVTDLTNGSVCALKRLHPQFHDEQVLEQVRRDALLAAGLGHPAILPVRATGVDEDGSFYLVTSLPAAESLRTRLLRRPLTLEQTAAIFSSVCNALQAAHEAGLHHGDLGPGNVLCPLKPGGEAALLTDFGMYHLSQREAAGYLPPEVYRGDVAEATARGDVFALGALLFECLTGQRLFDGPTAAAVMFKVCLSPLPSVDALLPARTVRLAKVVEMACSKEAEARFEAAGALWRALQTVLPETEPVVPPAMPPPAPVIEQRHQVAQLPVIQAVAPPPASPAAVLPEGPPPAPAGFAIGTGRERRSTLENWMEVETEGDVDLGGPAAKRPAFGGLVLFAGLGALLMSAILLCAAYLTGRLPRPATPSPPAVVQPAAPIRSRPSVAQPAAPVVDDAALLGDAQRKLGERDYPAALSLASEYLRRHPGDPAAQTISQEAVQTLRLLSVYDGFVRAAERGDVDTAVALYRELPPGSPYQAQARRTFGQVREQFEESHLQVLQAALNSGACDEVKRQVEQLQKLNDGAEAEDRSAYAQGRHLLSRCRSRDGAPSSRKAPRSSDLRDPFKSTKARDHGGRDASLKDPFSHRE